MRNNLNVGSTPQEIAKSAELKERIKKEIDDINQHLETGNRSKKLSLPRKSGALMPVF
jgi:long-chain acyl-CoA synthetase